MKYLEVYAEIKKRIVSGEYTARTPLGSEHTLCAYFKVSRPTLRKAIEKLKQESFLHSRQGSGVFVNPPEFYQDNKLTSISERINSDIDLKNIVIGFQKIPASDAMAKIFNISTTSILIHYTRIRIIDGSPAIMEETWMPEELFPSFTESHCHHSVLHYIEHEAKLNISYDVKDISGKILNEQEAFLLHAKPGHLCLSIAHHVYLLHSVLAQYTIEILVSNKLTKVSLR